MPRTLLTLGLLLAGLTGRAQYVTLLDAAPMGDCIRLTPDEPYREGIAYSTARLDLRNPFEVEFDIYLGDKDDLGADGITFVLHNDPRGFAAAGFFGEGMGYGNIAPSVAVEFDTYQNYTRNDPAHDHVALLVNGANAHPDPWPEQAAGPNLEDDRLHSFRFRWNPADQRILVHLDGRVVCEGKKDLINAVFDGNPSVIWGFTASTGRKHNLQYFCLKRLAINSNSAPNSFAADKSAQGPAK
ncbi:L-type lectin-domain containing protein [Hymenobacter sp.]|uniref:L-type lectin-domain containing protein n=1 Tax=Hymenobacter sp. TaxID=1898978 RepID=UPI00286D3F52|nr:L-type lectin-domain containing protein [Hymenobacter sp.]